MIEVQIRSKRKKDGKLSYGYSFEIANIDGIRKWQTKYGFATKKEAKEAGEQAKRLYDSYGKVVRKDEISVADYLDFWIENDCKIDLKPDTVTSYEKVLKLIKPLIGKYRLKSITREVLQTLLTNLYDLGYSYNYLTVIKGTLTKSMNFAVDHHYIVFSPAVRLKIPKNRVPKVPTRSSPHVFIPPEIIAKIFARFPERTSNYIPLKIGYECGMRLGEVFGLCWEDIDFENKVIRVNRQVQWYEDKDRETYDKISKNGTSECGKGYWYFSEPKYKSNRIIEISDELTELLMRERSRQIMARDYYGIFYTNYYSAMPLMFDGKKHNNGPSVNKISNDESGYPIHLVCVRENGTYITPRTMQHTSRVIKKEIFKDFDFHSLRHTHASMLAEKGVEQKYIQTRLGHSDIKMTIDVYEHTTDTMRSRGREAINSLFS